MDLSRARRRIPRWLPQLLGYALSAGCLAWVLHGYPIREELIPAIKDLDWRWVAVAILSDLAVYVVHGWRWKTLLGPVIGLRFWRTVQAVYIGLFANEVLPLRVGELIRCYLLSHWSTLRISVSFASAAVERLIDGFWMVAAFLVTVRLVEGVPGDLILLVQVLGGILVAGAILLLWVVVHKQHVHTVIRQSKWASTLRHVTEGLHLMGSPRTMAKTILISLLYLVLQVVSVYALMKADRLDLSFWAAGAVLSIVRLWTVVPNAPGNIGLVNVACITALRLLEMEPNDAKTFSIIYFAALTGPLLLGGGIAVALTGVSITDLRDRARRGMSTLHSAHEQH